MAHSVFADQSLSIPCPQCGHEIEKTVGWIKANDQLTCGASIQIHPEREELLRGQLDYDKLVSDLGRNLR